MANGTRIVLVSDGVTEMFDPEENQFGVERVSRVMETSSAIDARQLVDDFSASLAKFRQSQPPFDDTTLLAAVVSSA